MRQFIWLQDRLRTVREFFQDQWFDRTRHVRTAGDVSLHKLGIAREALRDSEWYVPARPGHIREALAAMPLSSDVSAYTYIDFGSGKGRSIFVAAEWPFRRIIGVERSLPLHEQACTNVRSFRFRRARCRSIDAVQEDAAEFAFPDGKLVLYLFNPFGADTMARVMGNLAESLRQSPRHVVVVLLWPRCGEQVLQVPGMRMLRSTQRHQIFEVHANGATSQAASAP